MRASEALRGLAEAPGDRLTVETIFANLGEKSFALLVFLLGLPNSIPMPPPIALVCAFVLFGVALQVMAGRRTPWAPRYLLSKSVDRAAARKAVDTATPYIARLEQWTKPRMQWFGPKIGHLLIGLLLAFLAIGLLTAAPFIGQIPWGIAVCLVGLGLVESDGALIVAGTIMALLAVPLSAGYVYAIFVGVKSLIV
jgi:hypothetical protein